jgi:hypothetical protein
VAWLSSVAVAVAVFVLWWVLFGPVAAAVIELVVVGLSMGQWVTFRRRARR